MALHHTTTTTTTTLKKVPAIAPPPTFIHTDTVATAMRASVAILMVIVILFLGITALNTASEDSYDNAVVNGTDNTGEAHNLTDRTFGQMGETFAPAVVWGGIAALILLAGAVLVGANRGR